MSLTTRAEFELNRCANIRHNLIELFIDSSIWGYSHRLHKSVKDVMTLYGLEKALFNAVRYNFSETKIEALIYKIREYLGMLKYVSRVDYFLARYPNVHCSADTNAPYTKPKDCCKGDVTNIINQYYPTTYIYEKSATLKYTEWISQELTPLITEDGQTTITPLNFDISKVDIDTLRLEVQGDDSHYTTTGEGYHIIGNTLYWHSFYDLKVGMQVTIKWRKE